MQQERERRVTPSNIEGMQRTETRGKNVVRGIAYGISVVFIVVLLCGYDVSGEGNAGIAPLFKKVSAVVKMEPTISQEELSAMEIEDEFSDIFALQEENEDCVGWLSIAGTDISHPVMQKEGDNDYYLDKDFNKKEDSNGCLILDEKSNLETEGGNLIIHGHNMKLGEMFGTLEQYKEEDYGKEHSLVQFKTNKEIRTYLLVSVFYSKVYYEEEDVFKYYKYFGGEKEEFEHFYANIKGLSLYDTGNEGTYGDEFITLSTCAYHVDNGRFVVIGKRVY